MSFGDVIDQERIDNNRKRSQATMIFGLNALVSAASPVGSQDTLAPCWLCHPVGSQDTLAPC